jgi:hypothetical protein
LDGKKFIYRGLSIGFWCQGIKRSVRELSNAIITSPNVIEVKMAGFDDPEALIGIADLVEKLPNCSGVQIAELTITEHTAPYLAKLVSFPGSVRLLCKQQLSPQRAVKLLLTRWIQTGFLFLSLEECTIHSSAYI